MNLGFKIQKANVGIRISILEIPYVPIFRQNGQLWIFGPKFAQKWVLGSNFKNLSPDSELASWDTMCTNFQTERKTLHFLAQTCCPKLDFGVGISKI